jgi:hypothetical protein
VSYCWILTDRMMQADGPNDISEFFLPGRNAFIPTNLDVDKREVAEVSCTSF